MKKLLVSGYRAHELNIFSQKHKGIPYIKQAITNKLIPLLEDGLEWVITPGQYGTDLWACEAALELKSSYPDLKVSIIAAYSDYIKDWKEEKREYAEQLLRQVDYYTALSKEPYSGPWQFTARDQLLLRKTDGLLLFYDEELGEASPKYLKEKALNKQSEEDYLVISITSEEIQSIADELSYQLPD